MKLPRFTVRRLMLIVAVAALAAGSVLRGRRKYLEAERFYRDAVDYHRTNASFHQPFPELTPPPIFYSPPSPADLARERRLAEYHEAMALKYERALHHPWLPVAPDPPEPKDAP